MRRCGKQYGSEDGALRSKAGQGGGVIAEVCRAGCGKWHLVKPSQPRAVTVKPARPASRNAIPGAVCRLVDKRDHRQCVRCRAVSRLHRHHRRIKGAGGDTRPHTDCACNIVTLCEACHTWAHVEDRAAAERAGLILPRAELAPWLRDLTVPGEAGGEVTARLTCDGEYADEIGLAA